MALDTSRLLAQVKIKATLPDGRYEDSEILDIASDVLLSQLVPFILSMKEEYLVRSESQAITKDVAAYPIPYRAYNLQLREVKILRNLEIVDPYRIDPTAIKTAQSGVPESFYLEGQDVVLYPTPASTQDTLKLSYFLTPSKPVLVSKCALITNIDRNTGIVTATPPSAWTSNNTFDFVSHRNGHKTLSFDAVPVSLTTTTITFSTSDIPSTLEEGDYIALSGEAPYLQVPDALFPMAVQMIANELLEDMGDQAAIQVGQAKLELLKGSLAQVMSVRVQGAPKRSRIRL
jgi:hypothetical protein